MRLIVKPHKIIIDKDKLVNEKEIDISKCTFEFDEEITDDFVKEALFTFKGTTYSQLINNNECAFPQEVLAEKGQVEIGVVAYKVENEVEIKRYNPSPAYFNTLIGSLKENIENSEPITPTDKEQILSELANKQDRLVSGVNIKTINHESLLGEGNIVITGSGGSLNYDDLTNKPTINNVEITGNKTLEDLGVQSAGSYALASDIPTDLADLTDDSTHRLVTDTEKTTWNNKSNFSGNYNDLTNKPTIPTKISDLTDDSDFLVENDLKTINGDSLVGSGDIEIKDETEQYIYTLDISDEVDYDISSVTTETVADIELPQVLINNIDAYGPNQISILVTTNTDSCLLTPSSQDTIVSTTMCIYRGLHLVNTTGDDIDGTTYIECILEIEQDAEIGEFTGFATFKYGPSNLATKKYVDDAIASAITTTLNGGY